VCSSIYVLLLGLCQILVIKEINATLNVVGNVPVQSLVIMTERDRELVSAFGVNFFAHLGAQSSSWFPLEQWLKQDGPEAFLSRQNLLVHHIQAEHPSRIFPIPSSFQRDIGEWMRKISQDIGGQTDELFRRFAAEDSPDTDFHFVTYPATCSEEEDLVLLEENRDPLSHGTTGLISWQGAWMLSDWAFTFTDFLKDQDVLELGSGVGFFGLKLAMKKIARSITLTDCNADVLNFLTINAHINFNRDVSIALEAMEMELF
jgi:hypothetical protein